MFGGMRLKDLPDATLLDLLVSAETRVGRNSATACALRREIERRRRRQVHETDTARDEREDEARS